MCWSQNGSSIEQCTLRHHRALSHYSNSGRLSAQKSEDCHQRALHEYVNATPTIAISPVHLAGSHACSMPQKPLTNKGKRSLPKLSAANRHGKVVKHKKGKRFDRFLTAVSDLASRSSHDGPAFTSAGGLVVKPKKDVAKHRLEDQKV